MKQHQPLDPDFPAAHSSHAVAVPAGSAFGRLTVTVPPTAMLEEDSVRVPDGGPPGVADSGASGKAVKRKMRRLGELAGSG